LFNHIRFADFDSRNQKDSDYEQEDTKGDGAFADFNGSAQEERKDE